jgi:Asp-tRNA(Asn)/Glu-tRNA(Gln) amidotransferase A subunit family amidase
MPDLAPPDRREFLALCASLGIGGTLLPGVLWARFQEEPAITQEVLAEAEKLAGLEFTPEEREMMLEALQRNREGYQALRKVEIPNDVPPALHFDPMPVGARPPQGPSVLRPSRPRRLPDPSRPVELAFASVLELGALLRSRELTSEALTHLYLDRLDRHGPRLECVVTMMGDQALEQARRADRELDAGRVRGPLHGIPWGAKDLLATRGVPTTWGAMPYRDQVLDFDATVVRRLDDAGAVLVAKLTLGALAQGDVWFEGRTRSPWDLDQGSSGSSAGSAAAVAAGLVGFALGSETLGSIVSPASRCGTTAIRPTFGRVSRHGAMALSWSMDKLGPFTRYVEDSALVLSAIQGPDGMDSTVRDVPFAWDGERGLDGIRVGVIASAFEGQEEDRALDREALEVIRSLGVDPVSVELPADLPLAAMRVILTAEAAAAFDQLTLSRRDALLVRQDEGAWPNSFRTARFIPAVEYIQANRLRTLVMAALDRVLADVDVVVTPSFAPNLLLATNLSGHPVVVLPSGFRADGTPTSLSFLGGLWKDAEALQVARAYQEASGHHLRRPPPFA